MSEGTRKFKMNVASPLPICGECPWKIWCSPLNFRTRNPQGVETKVCPFWWMLMIFLREKGVMKDRQVFPSIPISKEEAGAIMDAERKKRLNALD